MKTDKYTLNNTHNFHVNVITCCFLGIRSLNPVNTEHTTDGIGTSQTDNFVMNALMSEQKKTAKQSRPHPALV